MKSALDYRLVPNLRVGLNGYLYRLPKRASFPKALGDRLMGVVPASNTIGSLELRYEVPGGNGRPGPELRTCKTGSGSGTPFSGLFRNQLPS